MPGEYTEFDRGSIFFFLKCKFARDSEAIPSAREFGDMLPQENLKKCCNLISFGEY